MADEPLSTDEGQTALSKLEQRAVAAEVHFHHPDRAVDSGTDQPLSLIQATLPLHDSEVTPGQRANPPPGYEILGELGRGGMGVVYQARHIKLNRLVALKMILAGDHAGTSDRARFLAEAEAVATLQHPHIVSLLEYGEHQGLPFFTLEFAPGGSLAHRLNGIPQEPRAAVRLVEQLARGIHHAHTQGIVHRDLKPGNVLLAGDGIPKITDFGLARRVNVGTALTATGEVLGTPSYMAPEQAGGQTKRAGPAADVYSLGAILYECLTGRPPFRAATVVETVLQVVGREPVSVQQLQPLIPSDVATICHKCLQKEPHRRYASALELAEDCAAFLEGKPVRARPVGKLERAWRWCRRNSMVATLLTLVVVSLLGGIVAATAFAFQAERARQSETNRAESEALAKRDADQARQREADARLTAQRQLIDLCASTGLLAAKQNEHSQALLWFGQAASLAEDDPERELLNRVRYANWLRRMWRPLRSFRQPNISIRDGLDVLQPHPDGRHLLLMSHAAVGAVWDLRAETSQPLPGDRPTAAAFSPTGDRLAVVAGSGSLEVYSFPDLKLLQSAEAVANVRALTFSADGRYLAWGGPKSARVWDCRAAKYVTPLLPHPSRVYAVRLAGNAQLATACEDKRARVYALTSDAVAPLYPPVPHWGSSRTWPAPEFVYNGASLLTIEEATVVWRDAATGKQQRSVPPLAGGLEVTALVPHADGRRVALAWLNGLRLWDAAAGNELGTTVTSQFILDATFAAQGEALVTAGGDCTVRVWSASPFNPLEAISYPLRHPDSVLRACLTTSGVLVSAQAGGQVCVWQAPPDDPVAYRFFAQSSTRLAVSADGNFVAPSGMSQRESTLTQTQVYDARTGKPDGPTLDPEGVITGVAFSPDGSTLATASSAGTTAEARDRLMVTPTPKAVQFWNWKTGERHGAPLPTPTEPRGLAYSPDGTRLAVACADGRVVLIDPMAHKVLQRLDAGVRSWPGTPNLWLHNGEVRFSPDSRRFVTWEMDRIAQVWDAATGRQLCTVTLEDRIWDAAFDATGAVLALSGQLSLWDAATGKRLGPPLSQPRGVTRVRFALDNRVLLAGCGDGMFACGDWPLKGPPTCNRPYAVNVQDLALSTDGRWIATASTGLTGVFDRRTCTPVAPPLLNGLTGLSIHITPDGKRAVVSGFGPTVYGLDLATLTTPAKGSDEELRQTAEALAGARIDENGGVVWLDGPDWQSRWQWYRTRQGERPWPVKLWMWR